MRFQPDRRNFLFLALGLALLCLASSTLKAQSLQGIQKQFTGGSMSVSFVYIGPETDARVTCGFGGRGSAEPPQWRHFVNGRRYSFTFHVNGPRPATWAEVAVFLERFRKTIKIHS